MDGVLEVSIIINNYNYERFIAEAIDSALSQIYTNIEVIVVDDGSTDSSRDVIRSYGDRILPLFQPNGKQGAAFNNGFAHSKGDIIIFLDADDYLYPQAVEHIVTAWQPGISKVHYHLDVVGAEGEPRGYAVPPAAVSLDQGDLSQKVIEAAGYIGVSTSGNALSRAALSQVTPIPKKYATTSDDYLSVLIPFFGEVVAISQSLGAYRIHDSNQWAMVEVESKRFHRFIHHDLQRCELTQQWGEKLNRPVPNDLYMRSFGRVWSRLSSLRLDPSNHPIPADNRFRLTWLGLRALWKYSSFNVFKRIIFSLWFLWVGLLPAPIAKVAITWLFAPHLRPKVIARSLNTLRSWITSPVTTHSTSSESSS
ncbi:MAG: glycosyltransferase [Cyanobacteria bacterium J06631_9]